jgi:hypothetical protein
MKKTVILLLFLAASCFGQQIGLSLGTVEFDPSAAMYFGDIAPPKNLCCNFAFKLSDDVKLNLSAGYGFERSHFQTNALEEGSTYKREIKLNGFPLELELQASKPFVILSGIRPFIGLGLGYYQYKSTATTHSIGNKTEINANIKGLAQYFTFGLDYRMSRKISAFLQFKKLGISGIEVEGDDPSVSSPQGKFKTSLKSKPGLGDLSVAVGILVNLHPGHESSIIEKLQ